MVASTALRAWRLLGSPVQHPARLARIPRRFLNSTPMRQHEALGVAAQMPRSEPSEPLRPGRPVTIQDILDRRRKEGKLVAGTAAYSDSDMFKGPSSGKPKAKRWDHHLTAESLSRKPCALKQAAKHLKRPGIISLGGGLPCPEYFPIESMSFKVPRVPHFSEQETLISGETITMGKHDITTKDGVFDLSVALNYGQSIGSPQLLRWVTEHTELVCNPPYADWRSALTVGSTGALEQTLRMLCDRERGDAILTEQFSFSTALETAEPLGVKIFGIKMDEQGLLPENMDEILTNWDAEARGSRRPHVLYTVPSGQNPTGATMGAERRKAVYEVCQKHDIFIIEDEPYYFLQMQPYTDGGSSSSNPSKASTPAPSPPATVEEFLDTLIPTLLSMDVDGRVLRMDSFSKVVVPGSRTGWVTASEQIIERFIRHGEVANQGPSGFSQAALYKLLDETWGHEGYLRWLMNLRLEYTGRRDALLDACETHVPKDIVLWNPPAAGMFHWFQVDHTQHPDHAKRSLSEIEEDIFNRCLDKGVLVARGSWFAAEHEQPLEGLFFRATFAAATSENMARAIERFGAAVRESFGRGE